MAMMRSTRAIDVHAAAYPGNLHKMEWCHAIVENLPDRPAFPS